MSHQVTRRLFKGWPTLAAAGLVATGAGAAAAGLAIAHVGPFALQAHTVRAASARPQDAPINDLMAPPSTPSPEVEVRTVPELIQRPVSQEPAPVAPVEPSGPSEGKPTAIPTGSPSPTTVTPPNQATEPEDSPAPAASQSPDD